MQFIDSCISLKSTTDVSALQYDHYGIHGIHWMNIVSGISIYLYILYLLSTLSCEQRPNETLLHAWVNDIAPSILVADLEYFKVSK